MGWNNSRDYFDRHDMGMILIGMPGFDRQLARYPQLYSRVGFAHQCRPLDPDDVPHVLPLYWTELRLTFNPEHPADGEAALAITRITGGNFRLIERLLGRRRRTGDPRHRHLTTPNKSAEPRRINPRFTHQGCGG